MNWLLYGDAPPPPDLPPNVRIVTTTFDDYRSHASSRLGIKLAWTNAYKLCDLKPAFGYIHEREIAGYDHWGFGDLDVIYGDIRRFLTPSVLAHDLVTTHEHIVAGHFSVLRTTPRMLTAFKRVPDWRLALATPRHRSFDEQLFSHLFLRVPHGRFWRRLVTPRLGGGYFKETFSTNISDYLKWIDGGTEFPRHWYWDRGHLTTDRSGDREFLYLHFSNWQSNRWTDQAVAPWKSLDRLVRLPKGRPTGFTISAEGFTPLPAMADA